MELYKFFDFPLFICSILSKKISIFIIIPSLIYHIFVYIYLGILSGGNDFYNGFMYSFNYTGALVAYWIILFQSKNNFNNLNILSNELISNRDSDEININYNICMFNKCNCNCIYKSNYFMLMRNNMEELSNFNISEKEFISYCKSWKKYMKYILFFWNGIATINIILRAIPDKIFKMNDTFDNHPMALYGYYNLFGQFIASILIVNASVIILCGFYQVKCLIIGYAQHMRKYVDNENSYDQNIYNIESNRYIKIQKIIITLSELWSCPIIVSLFFCTQVAISNICVIHYELKDCQEYDTCDYNIIFPVIWLIASFYIIYMLTFTMSSINSASNILKNIFIYSKNDDYTIIKGRNHWIEYIESNPIKFKIYGIIITPTLVTNTIYTLGTAISSFLISNLFNK